MKSSKTSKALKAPRKKRAGVRQNVPGVWCCRCEGFTWTCRCRSSSSSCLRGEFERGDCLSCRVS